MLTGKELFMMYVGEALCVGEYRWEKLSETARQRWNTLAAQLQKRVN